MTGYLHPCYAESLAEFGLPRELPRCQGWILKRQIPGFSYHDGMGCHPLFVCRDWSQLHSDLKGLEADLVSLSLVTDPFGEYDLDYLKECFDVVIPFKQHFVADLLQPMDVIASEHHRYYAQKSLRNVQVERCLDPSKFLDEWVGLYATLIERHNLKGINAFSKTAFEKQLSTPGMVMFRAVYQGTTVGLDLWYVQGEVGYGHLVAVSPEGYRLRASYALKWFIIQYFIDRIRWLDLGAGAGVKSDNTDGLSLFKRGWSTGSRTAYYCGRIFNRARYSEIVEAKGIPPTIYFPAYRKGEFG